MRNRVVISLCSLMVLVAALVSLPEKGQATPQDANSVYTVFISGQELGKLKPCGCSEGQLGGLERRGAILNSVADDRKLLVHTGAWVPDGSEQNQIKYPIFLQAFSILGYDIVHLGKEDQEFGQQVGVSFDEYPDIQFIGAHASDSLTTASKASQVISCNGQKAELHVMAVGKKTSIPDKGENELRIYILNQNDPNLIQSVLNRADGTDCLVVPEEYEEPKMYDNPKHDALVVSIGRYGRYVGRLDIRYNKASNCFDLQFKEVKVSEELIKQPDLVEHYKNYQQLVSDSGLLERFLRVPLSGDAYYVGSKSCEECHEEEYATWSKKKHADAFATLEKVGSDKDPECVICHVVGMEYEEGFRTKELTPEFKDVGCEVCHGPGSEHNDSGGTEPMPISDSKGTCLQCHVPEHSGGYAGHEAEFLEKIRHWKEPNH